MPGYHRLQRLDAVCSAGLAGSIIIIIIAKQHLTV
jgi:hypothetical protein